MQVTIRYVSRYMKYVRFCRKGNNYSIIFLIDIGVMPFQISGHICCATCILNIRFAQSTNNNIFPYPFLIVFHFDRESKMPPNWWFYRGLSAFQLSRRLTRGSISYWLESRFARRVNRFVSLVYVPVRIDASVYRYTLTITGLSSGRFESRRDLARSEAGCLLSIGASVANVIKALLFITCLQPLHICLHDCMHVGSTSDNCRRLAVSSGYSGFLRQ